jgi:hypothetical protein
LAEAVYQQERAMPNESSPEQFLVELAHDAKRILWLGEMTHILKQIASGGYMSPIVEIFNHLFDCPEHYVRTLRGRGRATNEFIVEMCYLSISSTVTPEMLRKFVDEELNFSPKP